jgi:hypothetical protein
MDIWTKTKDGYCSEASTLSCNDAPMPETGGKYFSCEKAIAHIDGENETTHWTMNINGKVYTVFND